MDRNFQKYSFKIIYYAYYADGFVFQAEDADMNADIHGGWTVENAKGRLHQYLQTFRIKTDYVYKVIGPDHNRYAL